MIMILMGLKVHPLDHLSMKGVAIILNLSIKKDKEI